MEKRVKLGSQAGRALLVPNAAHEEVGLYLTANGLQGSGSAVLEPLP
jgi:hypothetical protein